MEEYKANQELSQAIQENRKLLRETLGKFFLDLAKIAFSTMVVGSILSQNRFLDHGRGKYSFDHYRPEPKRKLVFGYRWFWYYLCINFYRL